MKNQTLLFMHVIKFDIQYFTSSLLLNITRTVKSSFVVKSDLFLIGTIYCYWFLQLALHETGTRRLLLYTRCIKQKFICMPLLCGKKSLKIPKGQSESVYRRTNNTMYNRTNNDLQSIHIKLKIE